jgi:hypothetical protein
MFMILFAFYRTFDIVKIDHNLVMTKWDLNIQPLILTLALFGDVFPFWNDPT